MSKEEFKLFAKKNPQLIQFVSSGKTTWQNLYELYDIYGEDKNIWNQYIQKEEQKTDVSFKEMLNYLKNIDMESVQKGIASIQKTITLLQEIGITKKQKTTYDPRPLYESFED